MKYNVDANCMLIVCFKRNLFYKYSMLRVELSLGHANSK